MLPPSHLGSSLIRRLRELLRPPACLACGRLDAWPCCAACLRVEPAGPGPWPLAADPTVALWTLGLYRDGLRAAVLAGKLAGQGAALTTLGHRLGAALHAAGAAADLVTWIASRPSNGRPRDHARRVAEGVAARLDLPTAALLTPAGGGDLGRARARDAPGGAATATQRPLPRARHRLRGGRILLVDDVTTTGHTLTRAAAVLRRAGARHVEAATLAAAAPALRAWQPPHEKG